MKKILQLALLFLATFGLVRGVAAETRLLEMRNIDARVGHPRIATGCHCSSSKNC